MSNGRLSLCPEYLGVQMVDAARSRVAKSQHGGLVEALSREEVKERAKLTELGDEPQLHLQPDVLVVGGNEAEDVGVAQEAGLVDFHLVEPRQLLPSVEDLHRHIVTLVHALPDLTKTALPNEVVQRDLPSDGTLY